MRNSPPSTTYDGSSAVELVVVQHDAHPLDLEHRALHPGRGVGALELHGLAVDLELGAGRAADHHPGLALTGADQHERRQLAQPARDQCVEGDVEAGAAVDELPEARPRAASRWAGGSPRHARRRCRTSRRAGRSARVRRRGRRLRSRQCSQFLLETRPLSLGVVGLVGDQSHHIDHDRGGVVVAAGVAGRPRPAGRRRRAGRRSRSGSSAIRSSSTSPLIPSLHRSSRSTSVTGSTKKSAGSSRGPPSARVMTCRSGCSCASVAVISPESTSSWTTLWSMLTWRSSPPLTA